MGDAMEIYKLHHEQLDCYQAAIEFLVVATRIAEEFPRGYGGLTDQLRRASLSIPLNIAEGYGKRGIADRSRFYDIARGSAHECGAIVDAAKILGFTDDKDFADAKRLLYRVVSMLVKLVRE
jgi:four helix bundle protein